MTQIYEPQHQQNRRGQTHMWVSLAAVTAVVVAAVLVSVMFLTDDKDNSKDDGSAAVGIDSLFAPTAFAPTAPLQDAAKACGAGTLADENHTLVLDMAGEEPGSGTVAIDEVLCVLGELHSPQAVIAQMESTRALDGMQSTTWSDYEVTWTYHPNDGLDLIITNAA